MKSSQTDLLLTACWPTLQDTSACKITITVSYSILELDVGHKLECGQQSMKWKSNNPTLNLLSKNTSASKISSYILQYQELVIGWKLYHGLWSKKSKSNWPILPGCWPLLQNASARKIRSSYILQCPSTRHLI